MTKWQAFWIANVITVTGDRRAAEALARAPGVLEIASEMKIDEPERPLAAPLNRVGEFDFALVSGN